MAIDLFQNQRKNMHKHKPYPYIVDPKPIGMLKQFS